MVPRGARPLIRYRFVTADVFTHRRYGGNPLAVVPHAAGLGDEAMLAIAREFNLSETVFVFPPAHPAHARRLRIFTPAEEIPFAGHPTVGAALVLATLGEISLEREGDTSIAFEEGVGVVPVRIRQESGVPAFAQLTAAQAPVTGPPPPGRAVLAELLSLDVGDLLGGMHAPQGVSCGLPFLIVPLRDRSAVGRARVRMERWEASLEHYWAPQILVYSRDAVAEDANVHARVFVPGLSVPEDPATGSAAVALGAYLAARESGEGVFRYVVEQGLEMGRPSRLEVEAERAGRDITAVRVGGRAVLVMEGELTAP